MHHVTDAHDNVIHCREPREEAKILYSSFHPFPEWVERIDNKGHTFLSYTVTIIIFFALLNGSVTPNSRTQAMSIFLWWVGGIWVALFFLYLAFHLIYNRRKAKLFREHHPGHARYLA